MRGRVTPSASFGSFLSFVLDVEFACLIFWSWAPLHMNVSEKMKHLLHLILVCTFSIVASSCSKSENPPSEVAEKLDIYSTLKSEFATIDVAVERDSGRSFLTEKSKGLWRTDVNFRLVDAQGLKKQDFSTHDEERAIKALRKHTEDILLSMSAEIGRVVETSKRVEIPYEKGIVNGSIVFDASAVGREMALTYSHEQR
jgi:hypothetical protein